MLTEAVSELVECIVSLYTLRVISETSLTRQPVALLLTAKLTANEKKYATEIHKNNHMTNWL